MWAENFEACDTQSVKYLAFPYLLFQKCGLAGQLLKIKDQYQCLVKLIKKMESAKYTIEEAVQAIQELDVGEDTCTCTASFLFCILLLMYWLM